MHISKGNIMIMMHISMDNMMMDEIMDIKGSMMMDEIMDIKGSMMMDKIMDMGSMMKIMISAAWCNMQWCSKRTRCSMMIGEGVTLENQLKQNVFN